MSTVVNTEPASAWRYWREPIFSWLWWRRRTVLLGSLCGLLSATLAIAIGATAGELARGVRVFVELAGFSLAVLACPPAVMTWLSGKALPAGWRPAALGVVVVLQAAIAVALYPWWSQGVKAVIPTEPNKAVVFMAGMGLRVDEGKTDLTSDRDTITGLPKDENGPGNWLFDAGRVALIFWLAGGFALLAYFPQQRRLAEAQRRRELAAAQAARREAELKLSVLAAQVEPHFLFNTLAGVRGAVASDPARAVTLIDRLADYLRLTIPRLRADGEAQGATLGRQLEIVEAYLALIHARLPRLAVSVQVPPELAGARFPPLMLISLAENAVKHGIEPKVGAARIEVAAQRDGEVLAVSVCDDGVGFTGSGGGSGLGLANIRERLAQLYGARAALTLVARDAGGVCATISVPYEPVADADRDPR